MNTLVREPRTDTPVIGLPKTSFLRRLMILPFESAIALISVWTALASMFGMTPRVNTFRVSLPPNWVLTFNLLYIVAGLGILLGIGWAYRNLEASALLLLITSLAVRGIAIIVVSDVSPPIVVAQVTAAILVVAAIFRLLVVWRNGQIVKLNGDSTKRRS